MAYGLEVFNSAGTKILGQTDRVMRVVATGTVSVNKNSYVDITVTGMANDDSWVVGLNNNIVDSFTNDWYFTKSTNNLRIGYNGGSNASPSRTMLYYIFRS